MALLTDLSVDFVSLVDRAAVRDPQNNTEPRRFLFWKSEGNEKGAGMSEQDQDVRAALDKAQEEQQTAEEAQKKAEEERDQALKAQQDAEEALKAAQKGESEEEEDEDEAKAKTKKAELPPEVTARIEKAEAEAAARIEKAEKAAEEATEIAKAERDQRVTAEFVKKAEGYRALGIKPVEFGPVLKRAQEKLDKEDYEALDSLLTAADEQIVKGELFKEYGRDGGGSPGDAFAEAQAKAAELKKADPSLTDAQALQKAMESDAGLAARYQAETR